MANNVTASFEEVWARQQQDTFLKRSVAMIVADTSFKSSMKSGDVLKRTYRSVSADDAPDVYVSGSDMTVRDITDTAETLTVNKKYGIAIQVDDFDEIQSKYNIAVNYGTDYGVIMQTQIDADVLGEVVNAESTVDGGDVGATAGNGIVLTVNNVLNTVAAVTKKLRLANVYDTNNFGIISPEFEEILTVYYGSKATDLGDKSTLNGFYAKISGFDLHSSNNLTGTASLALATQPTADDTIVIQGVTFTFKAVPSAAGEVDLGSDVDATRANLAALINAPSTTTAGGIALTAADARKFIARVSAVNDDTADTLIVTYKGAGVLAVSETLTDGTDVRTTTQQKQLCVFGVKNKATTLVMQKMPSVERTRIPLQFGDYIKNGMLYGLKTFLDNSKKLVSVHIASSAF